MTRNARFTYGWGIFIALGITACGPTLETPDGGPLATPATGGGVCCPLTASGGCSPMGFFGGWAESGSGCRSGSAYDGPPHVRRTDDHGCAVLLPDTTQTPCGAVFDAGTDAGNDAGDASSSGDAGD